MFIISPIQSSAEDLEQAWTTQHRATGWEEEPPHQSKDTWYCPSQDGKGAAFASSWKQRQVSRSSHAEHLLGQATGLNRRT